MGSLKTELFFHFNTKNWNVSRYSSEKYQLTIKNQYPEITFVLSDSHEIFLSGHAINLPPLIDFTFNEESQWLKSQKTEKHKVIELLEHLFLFMEVQEGCR